MCVPVPWRYHLIRTQRFLQDTGALLYLNFRSASLSQGGGDIVTLDSYPVRFVFVCSQAFFKVGILFCKPVCLCFIMDLVSLAQS